MAAFDVMKTISASVFLLFLIIISTEGQGNPGTVASSLIGLPPSNFFLNFVLQSRAQRLLSSANGLAEDLRKRIDDTMASAKLGFDDCNAMENVWPWMQIRCITTQLHKSKNELNVIEKEAAASTDDQTETATLAEEQE